tara:strand:- start:1376 stop:2845 length:1470 start_codon:yes stop_codon:yes gene_type:complete
MKINELHNQPVSPDTYEASMALNQLLKIGKHAIKIHNMIDDHAEMESWVAKKIDLAGDYVKKVHGYMQGEKAGLYDDGGMTEIKKMPKGTGTMYGVKEDAPFGSGMDLVRMAVMRKFISAEEYMNYGKELKAAAEETAENYDDWPEGEGFGSSDGNFAIKDMMDKAGYEFDDNDRSGRFVVTKMPEKLEKMGIKNARMGDAVTTEDAGEGHMSKSTLYHTAKYAIELMQMIDKGDDLEGWVQSKLNKAADYLQGVHNYEEYQKLNPYREELDVNILQKHAGIVQKNIDEILGRETSLDDVDTKPGMMRILAKRVNEVEKEIAKKTRKDTNESGILYRAGVKKYGKAGMKAIQSAAAKGANHQEIGKIKDKHLKDDEVLDEGIKDWAKNLAMAGVIVAGLAGVGSIQDAIDRSIPAVQAMETALELAQDQGNDELADMIKKDLSAVKVRLESGKDLGFVKGMQDKYSKFVKTEGLAYESRLAIMLDQRIK